MFTIASNPSWSKSLNDILGEHEEVEISVKDIGDPKQILFNAGAMFEHDLYLNFQEDWP